MTAGQDDPRVDHFLVKLDRMVNEDRIDDPREVRAALDEAQATIRRLRAGGGVTAGQDERDRELAILHRSLSTFERIVDNAFNAIPDDVVAEDDSLASYIRAALAAAAAPAVDTAAPDPLRAPVEALLAVWDRYSVTQQRAFWDLNAAVAEVRRHLDGPAKDEPQDGDA